MVVFPYTELVLGFVDSGVRLMMIGEVVRGKVARWTSGEAKARLV
jgi:hypothetical protein